MICLSVEDGLAGGLTGAGEEVTLILFATTSPGCQDGGGPCQVLAGMGQAGLIRNMPTHTLDTTVTGNSIVTPGGKSLN